MADSAGLLSPATVKMEDMAPVTPAPLVGRDAELEELGLRLGVDASPDDDTAAPGGHRQGGVVLLSGDAGVGKTRLLTALRDQAVESGWHVVAGHCLDFADSALPYLPFSEILGRVQVTHPDVVDGVAAHHPALLRLQPGRRMLDEGGGTGGANVDKAALFAAVHALFEALAEVEPLVVVVEDLHWADQSTRDLLSYLFTRPFAGRVALVASYRSDDLHRKHPLRATVAEWSRLQGVARMSLGPLGPADVRLLVAGLHADLNDREIALVVERAEGNAFFVEELVGATTATHDTGLPADLAEVLLVRLDRLDETARGVVRAASVAGRRVTHELLFVVADLDAEALDGGLRTAVERNILVATDRFYSFRHALLGEAVYDDLLPGERVRLHGRYVEAIRDGGALGTAAELARHAQLAHDDRTALLASIQAGNDAALVGGPVEAAQHYERALGLLAAGPRLDDLGIDRARLAVEAGDALTAAGHPERAAELLAEQLASLPDDVPPEARAIVLAARAVALTVIETPEDPVVLSTEAVRLLPEGESVKRAKVLAAHARVLAAMWYQQDAQQVGLEALALAERLNRPDIASEVVTTLSGLRLGTTRERLREALQHAIDQSVRAKAVHAELRGRYLLARSFQDWGEFEEAERGFAEAVRRAEEAGSEWSPHAAGARWHLAWVHYTRGEWDDVMALTDVSGSHPPPVAAATFATLRAAVRWGRGEDVGPDLAGLRAFWRLDGVIAVHAAGLEIARAATAGDVRAAGSAYDDVVATVGAIWHPWFDARVRLAAQAMEAVSVSLPDAPAAERPALLAAAERWHADGRTVVERYADPTKQWGPEGHGWLTRLDAELVRARWLAGSDDAPTELALATAWREVVSAFEDFGSAFETARAQVVLASVLRATGDLAGAREVGDAARATARRLGARPLVAQLRSLESAPARHSVATDLLTPRETEILGLVAAGRTNGEIGRQLFISTKTVSVHVSNILAKLGASGRTEAAAIARRRGLLG